MSGGELMLPARWVFAALASLAAVAQAQTPNRPLILDPVVVTATRLPERLADVPAAISVVEQSDIQDARPTVSLDEPLNRVPGVFVQNSDNFAQDFRIQIRGFGTRAAFGVREIKVLVDGLPETLPDGQTELDGLDLGAVSRIEVLRGPASSLYGNAAGGVIQLFTEDGPDVPAAEARLTGGSFGFGKYQVKGGGRAGAARFFLSGSFLQLDGYRDHSATRSGVVNAKLRYDVDDRTDVTVLLNAVDAPSAEDPGGLTRTEADTTPRKASPLNVQLHAGEEVQQGRLGIVAHHRTTSGELSAYAYGLYRDFANLLPVPPTVPPEQGGIVTFHRFSPGAGLRYLYAAPLAGWAQQLTVGVDAQHQDDARRRYSNVNGERGALGLQQRERVTSVGPYLREAVFLRDDLEVSAGARYDSVLFDTDVKVPANSGASGSRTLDAWSPAGGVRYSPRPWLSLFADVGTAFQVPTTTELANPNGPGFNPDVGPQHATSYEAGARTEWERVQGEIVGYFADITDELIRTSCNRSRAERSTATPGAHGATVQRLIGKPTCYPSRCHCCVGPRRSRSSTLSIGTTGRTKASSTATTSPASRRGRCMKSCCTAIPSACSPRSRHSLSTAISLTTPTVTAAPATRCATCAPGTSARLATGALARSSASTTSPTPTTTGASASTSRTAASSSLHQRSTPTAAWRSARTSEPFGDRRALRQSSHQHATFSNDSLSQRRNDALQIAALDVPEWLCVRSRCRHAPHRTPGGCNGQVSNRG